MICQGVSIRTPAYKRPNVERSCHNEKLMLPKTINREPQASTAPPTGPSFLNLGQPRVALPFLAKFRPSKHLTSCSCKTELTLPKLTVESPVEKSLASYAHPAMLSVPGLDPSTVARPMYRFPPSRPRTMNPSNLKRSLRTEARTSSYLMAALDTLDWEQKNNAQ
ncbi:hypothetical protein G5714_020775 [Onychostoma macrolepis]|uniref:Uncharacterized protein n=1 Tax=Onychostoma macrolepis TaxID=369639 RepID=A0A7J6BWN2_9TELE|nr:hypothetical protein G5714_020775 [Onychostoma macrolepis]